MNDFFRYIQVIGIITACVILALIYRDLKNQQIRPEQINAITAELKSINLLLNTSKNLNSHAASHSINAIPAIPATKIPTAAFEEQVELIMTDKDIATGNLKSRLFILEYTDYQCPFCQKFHSSAFKSIEKYFIANGKVIYISRDFPLQNHTHAKTSAIAARCAEAQNKFWLYRDILFENQAKLERNNLLDYAEKLDMDIKQFDRCLDNNSYAEAIDSDIKSAEAIGVNGTPTLILGKVDGKILRGVKISGALNYETYKRRLEELARN